MEQTTISRFNILPLLRLLKLHCAVLPPCRRLRHFCQHPSASRRLLGGSHGRWLSLASPSGSSTPSAQVRCVTRLLQRECVMCLDCLQLVCAWTSRPHFAVHVADRVAHVTGFVVTALPQLFTKSAAVVTLMASLAPIMAATITVHTASMATEGMLLAGRDLGFLVRSYAVNATLVVVGLKVMQAMTGTSSVVYVWFGVLQFQATRLVLNMLRLVSRNSCLNAKEVLVAV